MLKTQDGQAVGIKKLNCEEAMPILEKVLPDLAKILHIIPANLRPPFYKVSYEFGARIIDKSGVYLPLINGDDISFNDPRLPESLINALSYDFNFSNPLGIILNKNCEFFVQNEQRIIPHMVIHPGEIFGLSRILDNVIDPTHKSHSGSAFLWDLTAGVRSIFTLSKVADRPQHLKLQKHYDLSTEAPKTYQDQFSVFKEIAHKANSSWRTDVLFFDNKWFDLLKHPDYGPYLYMQLSSLHKLTNKIWHHMMSWDNTYGQIELKKSLHTYPLEALYTAKHLFAIPAKCAVGFKPADNESSAPVKLFQSAYVDGYELEYCPTIMEPTIFCSESKQSVYYSMNCPTLPQYSPEKNHPGRRVISSLYKTKQVMDLYKTEIQTMTQDIRAQSLQDAVADVDFFYYHDDPQDYGNIKNAILLPEEDARFISHRGCKFPLHSSFLKGLIKITPKK